MKPSGQGDIVRLRSNTHIREEILDLKYFAQFWESWQKGTLLIMKASLTMIWLQPFSWSACVFMDSKRNVVWPHAQSDTLFNFGEQARWSKTCVLTVYQWGTMWGGRGGGGKLIFMTQWSTIFIVHELWCTEKLISESWLKCTPWNVNGQNPWLCTHTLKIN